MPHHHSSPAHRRRCSPLRLLPLGCFVASGVGACSKDEAPRPAPSASSAPTGSASDKAAPTAKATLPTPPESLGAVKTPANNPTTAAKVRLGNQLFFDQQLSVDGTRSCYSCHQNEDGTGGHEPMAVGAQGKQLTRNAPVMWNVAYLPRLYWDGRADSLEAQVLGAWAGGNLGIGKEGLEAKAEALGDKPEYRAQFDAAFPGIGATPDTVAQAISAYERTLFCGDTAFDRFVEGDQTALNAEQKAGMDIFTNKAECHSCHTPPHFPDALGNEDGAYHNVGVGIEGKSEAEVDVGRQKVTGNASDWAAFKTPTLRNVTKTAPYLHDGSIAKLDEVVRFMAGGGHPNKALDEKMIKMRERKLSEQDVTKLVSFLGALECSGSLTPPK
jgi:cytochrome c peroxidase